jgi:hypothetical protein
VNKLARQGFSWPSSITDTRGRSAALEEILIAER